MTQAFCGRINWVWSFKLLTCKFYCRCHRFRKSLREPRRLHRSHNGNEGGAKYKPHCACIPRSRSQVHLGWGPNSLSRQSWQWAPCSWPPRSRLIGACWDVAWLCVINSNLLFVTWYQWAAVVGLILIMIGRLFILTWLAQSSWGRAVVFVGIQTKLDASVAIKTRESSR